MEEAVEEENNSNLKKYFLLFSTKYWKNGRSQAKKIHITHQILWKCWKMEEAVGEGYNSKLQKIFSFIFHKILEEWNKLGKKIHKTHKKLWKYWKKLWDNVIIQSYKKYFFSFSTKYWKNGRGNSQDLAKTLEMLEEWKKLCIRK